MMAFILGTLMAWLYKNKYLRAPSYIGVLCLIVGIVLGGYPTGVKPTEIYRFLNFGSYVLWHVVGAALTIYGIYNLNILKRFLSLRLFKMLGNISYAVYIIQIPILFSISTSIFIACFIHGLDYRQSTVVSLVITLVILVALSWLYHKYIERICDFVQRKIVGFFMAEKKN